MVEIGCMAKQEPELFDTEIRATQVGHSIPCVGGFDEGFEHVERGGLDAVAAQEFLLRTIIAC
jgi:hypothetical protein